MNEALRNCTICHVGKPLDDFEATSKDGKYRRAVCKPCYAKQKRDRAKEGSQAVDRNTVPKPSACAECGRGVDEVDFGWRADIKKGGWRSVCVPCITAKGAYKEYRARKLADDPVGYRAHNASTHLAWAHNNPEKIKEQQVKEATLPERKIKVMKTSAGARDVPFADDDKDKMTARLSDPCYYCAFEPAPEEPLNGLDRLDAALGYTDANTVSCCATCNSMKGALSVDEFIYNVRKVVTHSQSVGDMAGGSNDATIKRRRLQPFSGNAERRVAEKVDKTDQLPEGLRLELLSSACYLCDRAPALGVDRVDSKQGYVSDNVRSCCTDCNYMKKDLVLDDFMDHVRHIHNHASMWMIGDVADMPLKTSMGFIREPVTAEGIDGKVRVVFPSVHTIANIIDFSYMKIYNAIDTDRVQLGFRWRSSAPRQYREQAIGAQQCKQVLEHMMQAK